MHTAPDGSPVALCRRLPERSGDAAATRHQHHVESVVGAAQVLATALRLRGDAA